MQTPVLPPNPAERPAAPHEKAKAQRILLVEDDDSIRIVTRMSLAEVGGFVVLALGSGQEALDRAASFAPDLLVLDVSMPGLDGPQTLLALRKQPQLDGVPAVFLTAHTQASEVARLRSLGAVDVIAKPFDPAHLCERVRSVLDQAAAGPNPAAAGATPGA